VSATRKLRNDYGLSRQRPAIFLACSDAARREVLCALASNIATLTTSAQATVIEAPAQAPAGECWRRGKGGGSCMACAVRSAKGEGGEGRWHQLIGSSTRVPLGVS
jgi:hypothetical protein